MKTTFKLSMIGTLAAAGLLILGQSAVHAGVTGSVCSTCHTMHNSSDGTFMGVGTDVATEQPSLTKDSCLGCHTASGDTSTNTDTSAPAVNHTGAFSSMLAGGDFSYAIATDNNGHNPYQLEAITDTLDKNPPGNTDATVFNSGTDQLSCAMSTAANVSGCHELGGHHTNNNSSSPAADVYWADGTSVGNSYRFLIEPDPTNHPGEFIKGGEVGDWEWSGAGNQTHNLYWAGSGTDFEDHQSISGLCTACHGDFHGIDQVADVSSSGTGYADGGPWTRHPTDFPLDNAGVPAAYRANWDANYDWEVPLGTTVEPTTDVNGKITDMANYDGYDAANLDMVLCISCHRVHGSPYANILRWDYGTMLAGGGTGSVNDSGCFKCHDDKDANGSP